MATSWEAYVDEQDAIAEHEEIRQWPAAKKLHHLDVLYTHYQSACAKWEELDSQENRAFDLASLRHLDKRTKEYKDYVKASSARQQAGYAVQTERAEILDFLGIIYNPPDKED